MRETPNVGGGKPQNEGGNPKNGEWGPGYFGEAPKTGEGNLKIRVTDP